MKSYLREDLARRFVQVIVSVGNLTQGKYGGKSMYMNFGEVEGNLATPKGILEEIHDLMPYINEVEGRDGMYLQGMISAYELYAQILDGENPDYATAIKTLLQVELKPMCLNVYQDLLNSIHCDLLEYGYEGEAPVQIENWLRDTKIPPEKVTTIAGEILDKAKKQTLATVIHLPECDNIQKVNRVQNVYWSGSSAYLGDGKGELTFNIDRGWSEPTFPSIVCHEGYSGHQAVYCNWDNHFLQGTFPLEGAFYSVVGDPTTPMAEGVPEIGVSLLGWDDLEADTPLVTLEEKRKYILGNKVLRIKRMVQQEGCYRYHVEKESQESVVDWMHSTGILSRLDAENTATFFTDPVQQYYYPAYYYGTVLLEEAYQVVPKEQRKAFLEMIYHLPQTTQTLCAGVSSLTNKPFNPFQ